MVQKAAAEMGVCAGPGNEGSVRLSQFTAAAPGSERVGLFDGYAPVESVRVDGVSLRPRSGRGQMGYNLIEFNLSDPGTSLSQHFKSGVVEYRIEGRAVGPV